MCRLSLSQVWFAEKAVRPSIVEKNEIPSASGFRRNVVKYLTEVKFSKFESSPSCPVRVSTISGVENQLVEMVNEGGVLK